MALQPAQHHNPDTPTRLAADLGIPDPVLDERLEASLTPRTATPTPRHRDDRRPVSMPAGMGRVRQGLDRFFGGVGQPQDGDDR